MAGAGSDGVEGGDGQGERGDTTKEASLGGHFNQAFHESMP